MSYKFNNFYEIITYHSKKHGKKVMLLDNDVKITYKKTLERTDKLAAFLAAKGVKEGDKVALFLQNSPEFIYAIFAVSKLGAILVPINTFLKGKELSYLLEDSGSTALIASTIYKKVVNDSNANEVCHFVVWEGEKIIADEKNFHFSEVLDYKLSMENRARTLEDTAVIIYTSGTTGKPKGAMLSNKNIISDVHSGQKTVDVVAKDRSIVFLPMFHSFTFSIGMMLPFYVGGSIVIIKSLKPFSNVFKQVLTKRVTLFLGIPNIYNALAKAKLPWYFMRFNKLRVFISGAAALQPKTLDAMAKKFKRAVLLEGYGLSEASPAVCMNTAKKQKAGSVGTAMYSYEMKIIDEDMNELPFGGIGDIIVKGDNVMQGYFGHPEVTKETIVNGWLLTGDVGYMDDEGFLFIVDRKKDLIISKGINIYPREIEEVIDLYTGVEASAVIGIVDENSGEVAVVYIELSEDTKIFDDAGLRKYMRVHLANYKIPKQIHVIDKLPKNATGKVLKRVLKEQLRENEK